jgi:hypothetical protein
MSDKKLDKATAEVDEALRKARVQRSVASHLADRWKQAREDNNFRQMIRELGGEAR